MSNLLKFEFTKLFKSASFYICGLILLILGILTFSTKAIAENLLYGANGHLDLLGYSGINTLLTIIGYSNFPVIIGILVSIGICSEYSNKTFKNVWARGFSRTQVYIAKIVIYATTSIIYSLILMIVGFLMGTILWGLGEGYDIKVIINILLQIMICTSYTLVFMMVAFVFKKSAIAVVISVAAPSLINIGATIIDYILKYKNIDITVSNYLLSKCLSALSNTFTTELYVRSFIVILDFLLSAAILGWLGMRKDEI